METTKDMTKGSVNKNLVGFALPIFLSQLFQQLYNTADSLIVGRFLGTEALAAVSSAGNLVFLLISFFTGLAMGSGVLISKYFGAHDDKMLNRSLHTNLTFGLISGIALSIFGYCFVGQFLTWMNVDEAVLPLAVSYYRIYLAGGFSLVLYNFFRGAMSAVGDSKRPLFYLAFSSILNIILDIVFIAGFGWGVWSAAAATVISQIASMIPCYIHLSQKGQVYTVSLKNLNLDKDILKDMVKYGLPTGVQNSVIGFANVIVQSSINSFGMIATAAFGVHTKIEGFIFLPITSFTMALSTFISQNLGAKEYDRAKKGARFGIIISMILAETVGLTVSAFAPTFISMFDSNPEVIAIGTQIERIIPIFDFLLAFSHAIASICRGAGKAVVPMMVMLSIWCVLRVIYIEVVMALFNSLKLVFWAYPLTWSISSIWFLIYYKKSDWIHGFEK